MATRILHRRDTLANWTSINPVPYAGELTLETDSGKTKIGDGVTTWTALPYIDQDTTYTAGNGIAISSGGEITSTISGSGSGLTTAQEDVLSHLEYDSTTRRLVSDRAIETTLNSIHLGDQHKMSSGAENIFFTNSSSNINFYPMWGGLKDQSIAANQDHTGFIPPSGRVYTDMFSLPLGGSPDPATAVGYSGNNFFAVNIAGLGITTTAAEAVPSTVRLEYRLSVNGIQVYKQILGRNGGTRSTATANISAGDVIEWYFDHPVEIHAGTTIYAEITKVRESDDVDLGVFQVRQGDTVDPNTGLLRYQATVHNRLFEDKDLELISPYLKYTAMDFSVDSTGSSILVKDLSLPTGEELLIPHPINTLQAVADGTTIKIKVKGGQKVIVEALEVSTTSIAGNLVNSVLSNAVTELNDLFTNTLSFSSQGNPVTGFAMVGTDLTLTLQDSTSYTVDVTTLGVDTNNFVASGSISGTDLRLVMDDATVVTVDASSLGVDTDTTITGGSVSGNTLTITASDLSFVNIDVSNLAIDQNLHVVSGVLNGLNIDLTMSDNSVVQVPVGSLLIDNDTTINGGTVNGTDIVLSLSDNSLITIDASTLSTGSSTQVASGAVVGTDLVLTMADATTVTIDASNMVNGSTLSALNDAWYISYGANANTEVGTGTVDSTVWDEGPYYFGEEFSRGSDFKFNMTTNAQHRLGIWSASQSPTAFNAGQTTNSNWSTVFSYANGTQSWSDSSNTDVSTYNNGGSYLVANGAPIILRFETDGHLTLIDNTGGTEHVVGKTINPLSVNSFFLQFGAWSNGVFPNGIITSSDWSVVHDFDNSENGIVDGIEDHTVIKAGIGIAPGEQLMILLDRIAAGERFGTNYTGASSGVSTAEFDLINTFRYETNEAIIGGPAWIMNTASSGYFLGGGGSIESYRVGGANTSQGMFSLRYLDDNSIEFWSETNKELVMTAMANGDGNLINLHMGVQNPMPYSDIPVISKQVLGSSSQPIISYAPDVSSQSFDVTEGSSMNYQIQLDSGSDIVNMYSESDAPSWAALNQATGQFIGTAPAFTGTASDTYLINCKAGNAIGGITNFQVTINVIQSYTNTKSLKFPTGANAGLQGNANNVTALPRGANGAGAVDAWTISMWVKPSTTSTANQTYFYYGATDMTNDGGIKIFQYGSNNLAFQYGYGTENITFLAAGGFVANTWNHVAVTYAGGITGNNLADINNYTGEFTFWINGSAAQTSITNQGGGYITDIKAEEFKIGRGSSVLPEYLQDGIVNQVAIWDTDEQTNIATMYNAGATMNLNTLANPPVHYYEIENSTTNVLDINGAADLQGFNFTTADLVTDTP